jgi:hypothetical protein
MKSASGLLQSMRPPEFLSPANEPETRGERTGGSLAGDGALVIPGCAFAGNAGDTLLVQSAVDPHIQEKSY